MILTQPELFGLATVSGASGLPGLSRVTGGVDQARQALRGLQAKHVLGLDGRVTDFGVVPLATVDHYCRADQHLAVNRMRLSVNPDGALSVLTPMGEDWFLARVSPVAFMVALLRSYSWLRVGGGPEKPGQWEPLSTERWATARLTGERGRLLMVRHDVRSARASTVRVFDRVDGHGFEYDLERGRGRWLPVPAIRSDLAGLIGCRDTKWMGVGDG